MASIRNEIVKICKKHGDLTQDLVHPKGKSPQGKQYYGCLLCKRETAKKYYENNFDTIKETKKEVDKKKKLNPTFKEKRKKWMHDYQQRRRIHRGDELREKERKWKKEWCYRNPEKVKMQQSDYKRNLRYGYVKSFLKNYYGFENPSDELIHAKSTLMMLKREIMKLNVANGKNKYVKKTGQYKRKHQDQNAEKIIVEGSTEDFKKW